MEALSRAGTALGKTHQRPNSQRHCGPRGCGLGTEQMLFPNIFIGPEDPVPVRGLKWEPTFLRNKGLMGDLVSKTGTESYKQDFALCAMDKKI